MNNLNNIQKAMDNKGELARVPFLTYEERQAVKLEQTLLRHCCIMSNSLHCIVTAVNATNVHLKI